LEYADTGTTEQKRNRFMTLLVKLLTETAIAPKKGSDGAAGWDLYADEDCWIGSTGARRLVSTGIALAIDPDKVGLIWPRSGLAVKNGIDTGAGVIDSDYRGEVKILLFNHGDKPFRVRAGDRIAQLLIVPAYGQTIKIVEEFAGTTARGENGFGSTGT
jgi:dUTP pyrophosphatase